MTTTKKAPASTSTGAGKPKGKGATAAAEDVRPEAPRREYELIVIAGPPAFGKTSLADEIAARQSAKRIPVFVVDPNDAWKGVPYVTAVWIPKGLPREERRGALDALIAAFETDEHDKRGTVTRSDGTTIQLPSGPMLLMFDDADKYSRHASDVMNDCLTSFRHWGLDVAMITRRFQGISKEAIASANAFALFSAREVYMRRYLAELLGADVLREVPQEPHSYLYVRHDAYLTRAVYQTKQRTVVTKSTKPEAMQ